jgi:hypothetical protein
MRGSFWNWGTIGGGSQSAYGRRRTVVPRVELCEPRLAPAAPIVLSIERTTPAAQFTSATNVTYTVTFDQSVTGVNAADFSVATSGNLKAALPVVVSGSGAAYAVAISGIHGSGDLRLDLIDDDSIDAGGEPLGDVGPHNGSFQGEPYSISQTFPSVVSINRLSPPTETTSASTVSFTVAFSGGVTGVDPGDFEVVTSGTVATTTLQVTPVSASSYTATISGITGVGTLGLNLVDDGSIRDLAGNPLTAANAPVSFAEQATFATGSLTAAATFGDLNGDGKADLAAVNSDDDTVSVLLGNGDGTFQDQTVYGAGEIPISLTIGDVNGDGQLDLITANYGGSSVSVLLGNGDGTFQEQQTFTAPDVANSAALGDLNGDGRPDLAVAGNFYGDAVGVLLGNGDGTFQEQQTFATGAAPYAATIGDLNGDGVPDLAVADYYDNTVSVLLGVGDGTFFPRQEYETGEYPNDLALGDVNGDGIPDLATANYNDDTVSVLLGNGDGRFQAQQTFATGTSPYSLTLGDVNGDGTPDIAVANFGAKTVGVLLGTGTGAFGLQETFATGLGPYSVTIGDVNGDGRADLALANQADESVSVLVSKLNGDFVGQAYTIVPVGVATTTTLSAAPNASTGGMLVTFTATVSPSPGSLGTVDFKDNGVAMPGGSNVALVGGVATFQISTLTVGTHPISADYSGAIGFSPSTSNTLSFVVGAAPPQVASVTVNGNIGSLNGPQRSRVASLVVAFNQPVQLDPSAMTLGLHTSNVVFNGTPQPDGFGTLPANLDIASADNISWTVTFVGNTDAGADGFNSLRDGVYDLKIDAAKVHPLGVPGVNMAANETTTFHRLFGDTNAPTTPPGGTPGSDFEAIVNSGDNLAFRNAFNNPSTYRAFFDFNGDGVINSGDNLQFRNRFNKSLTWRA